jgi:hypothetical protein
MDHAYRDESCVGVFVHFRALQALRMLTQESETMARLMLPPDIQAPTV